MLYSSLRNSLAPKGNASDAWSKLTGSMNSKRRKRSSSAPSGTQMLQRGMKLLNKVKPANMGALSNADVSLMSRKKK